MSQMLVLTHFQPITFLGSDSNRAAVYYIGTPRKPLNEIRFNSLSAMIDNIPWLESTQIDSHESSTILMRD